MIAVEGRNEVGPGEWRGRGHQTIAGVDGLVTVAGRREQKGLGDQPEAGGLLGTANDVAVRKTSGNDADAEIKKNTVNLITGLSVAHL